MKVLELKCKSFRNIDEAVIKPCDETNVICGENAQGKTNLLEAIWLFTGAKSFRMSKDVDFLKFGSQKAVINLKFLSEGVENEAEITITDKRRVVLNQNKLSSPSLIAGKFNAVIFSPTDLKLVSDGPAVRRRFLDTAIGQIFPNYINLLKDYTRAVAQRNKVIKDFKYDSTLSIMLDVFEGEIANLGEKITKYRQKYIEMLNEFLPTIHSGISAGKETLETKYIYSFSGDFLSELKNSRQEDMYTGVTSIGPHRDDIDFKINGISARKFGSQGQKRSVALAVKLAEAEVINKNVGEWPVILLDEATSALDEDTERRLLENLTRIEDVTLIIVSHKKAAANICNRAIKPGYIIKYKSANKCWKEYKQTHSQRNAKYKRNCGN